MSLEVRRDSIRDYTTDSPENTAKDASSPTSAELSPEEAKAKQEVLTEVSEGLRTLHDYLQHDQSFQRGETPDEPALEKMLAQCGILGTMEPVLTNQPIGALRKDEKFRNAGLPEFVEQGTAYWIFGYI